MPRIETGTVGWEARALLLFYADPQTRYKVKSRICWLLSRTPVPSRERRDSQRGHETHPADKLRDTFQRCLRVHLVSDLGYMSDTFRLQMVDAAA